MAIDDEDDVIGGAADMQDTQQAETLHPDAPRTDELPAHDEHGDEDGDEQAEAQRSILGEFASALLSLFRRPKAVPHPGGPQPSEQPPSPRLLRVPKKSRAVRREEERELLAHMRAKETIEERLERYRQLIQDFEEDRENVLEKIGRWLFLVLAYVGPIVIALAVGKEIGDAYGGPFDLGNGWSFGMHAGAYFGEMALAMMSLSSATALRRIQSDKSYIPKLLLSALFLVVFSLASGLAQWYIALDHVNIQASGGTSALLFRVLMPAAVDIAALLYISIMKFKSLKSHIDTLKMEASALHDLNEAELGIRKSQNNAKQLEARERLLQDVEAIQARAVLKAVERSLNNDDKRGNGWQMRA